MDKRELDGVTIPKQAVIGSGQGVCAPASGDGATEPTASSEAQRSSAESVSSRPGLLTELAGFGGAGSPAVESTEYSDGPSEPPPEWPVVDGFRLLEQLGGRDRGDGMGEVYRALDLNLRVEVALKVPQRRGLVSEEQFINEARALAKVRHRNIVGIRSYGRSGPHVYFVMDLVDGPSAAELVSRFRKAGAHHLTGDRVLELAGVDASSAGSELRHAAGSAQAYYRIVATWLAEAADGLHAAHQTGLLHRDVKPKNFLIDRDGRLLVADFGLARQWNEVTCNETYCLPAGTPNYMPPERILGDSVDVDQRADIWALGATLYESLVYHGAYLGQRDTVLRSIVTRDPVPPGQDPQLGPHIPAELERICLKAMRRDPDERYVGADEMARDLRAWVTSDALPPKRQRRRAAVVVAASVLLLALVRLVAALHEPSTVTGIALEPAEIVFDLPAEPRRVQVYRKYADGRREPLSMANVVLDYGPGDSGVFAFDRSDGTLTPLRSGRATLIAKVGDLRATREVRVREKTGPAVATEDDHPAEPAPLPVKACGDPLCILLAVNEDLNEGDGHPARTSGHVVRRLHEALKEAGFRLHEPKQLPEGPWLEVAIVDEAAQRGMTHVLFGRAGARKVGPTQGGDHWNAALLLRLINVSTREVETIFDDEKSVARVPEDEFGGDQHLIMANLAAQEACKRLGDEGNR